MRPHKQSILYRHFWRYFFVVSKVCNLAPTKKTASEHNFFISPLKVFSKKLTLQPITMLLFNLIVSLISYLPTLKHILSVNLRQLTQAVFSQFKLRLATSAHWVQLPALGFLYNDCSCATSASLRWRSYCADKI